VIMTSGMVAARYLATTTTSMTSMMHPVAAVFDHSLVCVPDKASQASVKNVQKTAFNAASGSVMSMSSMS
jgi:hypothetical protein